MVSGRFLRCGGAAVTAAVMAAVSGSVAWAEAARFKGVKTALPIAALDGWSRCYEASYDTTSSLDEILAACTKERLLIACGTQGAETLTVAAEGARDEVMKPTGEDRSHLHNGARWYFDGKWSHAWGFAPEAAYLDLSLCDVGLGSASRRLCWTLRGRKVEKGGRCGGALHHRGPEGLFRLIYQAD